MYAVHYFNFDTLKINVEIGTYFISFHWYLKKMFFVLRLIPVLKQQFNECNSIELINGKIQINRDQRSNLLFLQQHNQSQKF